MTRANKVCKQTNCKTESKLLHRLSLRETRCPVHFGAKLAIQQQELRLKQHGISGTKIYMKEKENREENDIYHAL